MGKRDGQRSWRNGRAWLRAWTGLCFGLGAGAGITLGSASAAAAGLVAAGGLIVNQQLDWAGESVHVTVRNDGTITVQSGALEQFSARIFGSAGSPGAAVKSARAEVVAGGEARYLIIRAQTAGDGQRVQVVGKVNDRWASIYSGPVGPVGRDGEYALAVEAAPQGLLRYQRAPGVSRCDGEDRLFIERYQGGGWHPAPELALPELTDATVIAATSQGPAGVASPLGVYRFVAASAQVGVTRADLLAPPQELEDGKPATAWRVPPDARGGFVTARADGAGHSVRALRITPAPRSQGALPRQLALIFDGRDAGAKKRLLINLNGREGEAQWVQLPAPIAASCLSLLITQPASGAQPTALGKVAIFSELDADTSDAGLRQLASRAATADFTSAEAALRTLRTIIEREKGRVPQQGGPAATLLQAVAAALPGAAGAGRRRLHELLRALAAGSPWPELSQVLVRALAQAEAEERITLWAAIDQLGSGTEAALLQLVRDPQLNAAVRTETIKRLGGLDSPAAVQTLLWLAAKVADGAAEARALQRSVVAGLSAALHCRPAEDPRLAAALAALPGAEPASAGGAHGGELTLPQLSGAALLVEALGQALTGCPLAARARLGGRLVNVWPQEAVASPAASTPAAPAAGDPRLEQAQFTLRYRILQSLERIVLPTPDAAALVGQVIAQNNEPVLRQAAARAAVTGAAGAPENGAATKAVHQALSDRDPGVRLAVLTALAEHRLPEVLAATEQSLRSDRWPAVRRAAVESRAAQCPPEPVGAVSPVAALRQAVADADEQVQRQALSGLGRCEGAAALDVYIARLKDADAAPALRSQACALLVRHGFGSTTPGPQQVQAHTTVAAALLDLLGDPAADERIAGTVISCARAVGELGDARDLPVLLQTAGATASEVPPPIRQSALEAIGKICSRGPALSPALRKDLAAAFQSAGKDPEPRVQSAAQRAAVRCR